MRSAQCINVFLTLPVSNNSLIVAHHVTYFVSCTSHSSRQNKIHCKTTGLGDLILGMKLLVSTKFGVFSTINFNNALYIFPEWRTRNFLGSTTYIEFIPDIWLSLFHYVHTDNIQQLYIREKQGKNIMLR